LDNIHIYKTFEPNDWLHILCLPGNKELIRETPVSSLIPVHHLILSTFFCKGKASGVPISLNSCENVFFIAKSLQGDWEFDIHQGRFW
jgi:hypothetical protein